MFTRPLGVSGELNLRGSGVRILGVSDVGFGMSDLGYRISDLELETSRNHVNHVITTAPSHPPKPGRALAQANRLLVTRQLANRVLAEGFADVREQRSTARSVAIQPVGIGAHPDVANRQAWDGNRPFHKGSFTVFAGADNNEVQRSGQEVGRIHSVAVGMHGVTENR